MYEEFYGLSKRPFSAVPHPDDFASVSTLQEALDSVLHCISRSQGIAVITSAPGMGKSQLCKRLGMLLRETTRTIYLGTASFATRRAMLQEALFELAISYEGLSESECRLRLLETARELKTNGKTFLLIVDEAHLLNPRIFEELRSLADYAPDGVPLIHLVLAGQFELEEKLTDPALAAFNRRIGVQVSLEPLTLEDSARFIIHRLSEAGAGDPLQIFTEAALETICRASDGNLRCLTQLADHSMLLGFAEELRPIDEEMVFSALDDLKELPLQWNDVHSAGEEIPEIADAEDEVLQSPDAEVAQQEPWGDNVDYAVIEVGSPSEAPAVEDAEEAPVMQTEIGDDSRFHQETPPEENAVGGESESDEPAAIEAPAAEALEIEERATLDFTAELAETETQQNTGDSIGEALTAASTDAHPTEAETISLNDEESSCSASDSESSLDSAEFESADIADAGAPTSAELPMAFLSADQLERLRTPLESLESNPMEDQSEPIAVPEISNEQTTEAEMGIIEETTSTEPPRPGWNDASEMQSVRSQRTTPVPFPTPVTESEASMEEIPLIDHYAALDRQWELPQDLRTDVKVIQEDTSWTEAETRFWTHAGEDAIGATAQEAEILETIRAIQEEILDAVDETRFDTHPGLESESPPITLRQQVIEPPAEEMSEPECGIESDSESTVRDDDETPENTGRFDQLFTRLRSRRRRIAAEQARS